MPAFLEWIADKEFIRGFRGRQVGVAVGGRSHNFDHLTRIIAGRVHVLAKQPDGTIVWDQDFTAPAEFVVKAHVWHDLTPLTEDAEWHCVFQHRTPAGEPVDVYMGYDAANQ